MTRASAAVAAIASVLLVGCESSSKSPWRRKLTKAERSAWVTKCGVPVGKVEVDIGKNRDENDSYRGKTDDMAGPAGALSVTCYLGWNRQLDRALYYHVLVDSVPRAVLRPDEIAPYVELIAAEVPAAVQPVVRLVARGKYQQVRSGAFAVTGGFAHDPAMWSLMVEDLR